MNRFSIIYRCILLFLVSSLFFYSCEELVVIDLNSSKPAFVVEAILNKDSLCKVHLTQTSGYFSNDDPVIIEDATIKIATDNSSEELIYSGKGYYKGSDITGTVGKSYSLEIIRDGLVYSGNSQLPEIAKISNALFFKSIEKNIFNPNGDTVYTITIEFNDFPEQENYYMVRYLRDGKLLEDRYFMLTENSSNGGNFEYIGDNSYRFSESIFCESGMVDVQLVSMDKALFNYFFQLDDILFWKRRAMPPTPYNPASNISNNALGYFAAWGIDSKSIFLQ